MSIYEYIEYQTFLRDLSVGLRKVDKKFTISRIAEAIGVQKAYLSKVTKGQAHLSSDQVFLLCEYLQLDQKETSYLQLLVEYSRTGLKKRKEQLLQQIERLREEKSDSRTKLKATFSDAEASDRVAYYLDPHAMLVHLFLTIDRYRRKPALIAHALLLSDQKLLDVLLLLQKNDLIRWNESEKSYEVLNDHMQIHKSSPLSPPHQALTRVLSSAQLLRLRPEQRSTFNITFTAEKKTYKAVQESFLNWLKGVEEIVREAKPLEVFQLNFDLFPWDS